MCDKLKCPHCGKTGITGQPTTIDRRTGKKAAGLGTLIFGIVLLAVAVFLFVLIIINWDDPIVPGQNYIYLLLPLLAGAITAISSYLRADRIERITYKCPSCGKTFSEDEDEIKIPTKPKGDIEYKPTPTTVTAKKIFWIVAVLLVILVIVYLLRSPTTLKEHSSSETKTLVILPFINVGPPEDEDLADGITEAINSQLASVGGINVTPYQIAMEYKGSTKAIRQIGNELGVDYLLEGSVRSSISGSTASRRIRVSLQLVRIDDGPDIYLWTDSYERDLIELSDIQSDITRQVAMQLDVTEQYSRQPPPP